MLEGIINTQPTSDVVLGRVSTLAVSLISTFVRPYGPCTQVDIRLTARVDTRPSTPSSVGFVYVCTVNVDFFACIHFRAFPKIVNFAQIDFSRF